MPIGTYRFISATRKPLYNRVDNRSNPFVKQ